ncbi:hypothetical protein NUW54_g4479 [Trametes sanguinea]|uniref:Uncharacterized protein n=1 Tax=Trametes sanguinea TaxID=158606 RepID=A0ACC1Q0W3_9APHY|nr:hypothetical protein NUW54_g4479 [Trametes sanguinea]
MPGPGGLHVSNPDDHYDHREYRDREREHEHEREHQRKHYGPTAPTRVHVAQAEDTPDWNGGSVSLAYINELGRREDGYETVEEGTPAYSYRRD